MSAVLVIALGPVQDFIAQARRSRDLWHGSHILSEVSKAAAKSLAETVDTALVFPPLLAGDPQLGPCDGPFNLQTGEAALAVANKIVAVVNSVEAGDEAAAGAYEAAQNRWKAIAKQVKRDCADLIRDAANATDFDGRPQDADTVWDEQIGTLLEFYSACVPITSERTYAAAREEADALISSRKQLRDFRPYRIAPPGVMKSSLDGGRLSVLAPPSTNEATRASQRRLRQKFRIASTEYLDAVGLTKRCGGSPQQFVPVANVALAPFCSRAIRSAPDAVKDYLECLKHVFGEDGIGEVRHRNDHNRFKVDAQFLLPDRWDSIYQECFGEGSRLDHDDRTSLTDALKALTDAAGPTQSYVAVIVADGDRMGSLLETKTTAEEQREVSDTLSQFAGRARAIVEEALPDGTRSLGSLIYAGGDDVLAFVPVEQALRIADALRCEFADLLETRSQNLAESERPTLSVGIGIGHVLTRMGDLLSLARRAESIAKGNTLPSTAQRNALALIVDKRSGGESVWRCQWRERAVERLQKAVELQSSDALPMGKVQEIRRDRARWPAASEVGPAENAAWADLVRLDIERTLARAHANTKLTAADVDLQLPQGEDYEGVLTAVDEWLALHLVAREFRAARLSAPPPEHFEEQLGADPGAAAPPQAAGAQA